MNSGTRSIPLLGLLLGCFAAISCATKPTALYVETQPARFDPCPTPHGKLTNQQRSYAAMLKALRESKWTIVSTSLGYDIIEAEMRRTVEHQFWVTMVFQVDKTGAVLGFASPEKPVLHKMRGGVLRWMHYLDQRYTNLRCMDDQMVVDSFRFFGLNPLQEDHPAVTVTPPPGAESATPAPFPEDIPSDTAKPPTANPSPSPPQ